MIRKRALVDFINKYNLKGIVEAVKVKYDRQTLATKFISENKNLLGMVSHSDLNVHDSAFEFGIYNTTNLLKILNIMSESVNTKFNFSKSISENPMSLEISDDSYSSVYHLADLVVIENAPELKEIPPPDMTLNFGPSFYSKLKRAKSALNDTSKMAFIPKNGNIELVLNYSNSTTDNVIIKLDANECNGTLNDKIIFDSNMFVSILEANDDATESNIAISEAGLMTLKFKGENYNAHYYLVKIIE